MPLLLSVCSETTYWLFLILVGLNRQSDLLDLLSIPSSTEMNSSAKSCQSFIDQSIVSSLAGDISKRSAFKVMGFGLYLSFIHWCWCCIIRDHIAKGSIFSGKPFTLTSRALSFSIEYSMALAPWEIAFPCAIITSNLIYTVPNLSPSYDKPVDCFYPCTHIIFITEISLFYLVRFTFENILNADKVSSCIR